MKNLKSRAPPQNTNAADLSQKINISKQKIRNHENYSNRKPKNKKQ